MQNTKFHKWLYTACEFRAGRLKDAHDIFPYVDLTDAILAFIDDISAEEYSKTIKL